MIIQVSEKHAEGEYGETISDKEIHTETLAKSDTEPDPGWWKYLIMGGVGYDIWYVDTTANQIYSLSPYHYHKAFKKNTVITFTQDKLS